MNPVIFDSKRAAEMLEQIRPDAGMASRRTFTTLLLAAVCMVAAKSQASKIFRKAGQIAGLILRSTLPMR